MERCPKPPTLATPPLTVQAIPSSPPLTTSDTEDVQMEDAATNIVEDLTDSPVNLSFATTANSPTPPDAPLTEDTIQTEQMKAAGMIINTAMKIVICLGCHLVIRPSSIHSHFSQLHSLPVTRKFCQGLSGTYNLHKEPLRPGKIVDAIYGLEVFAGYLSCDNCGAAFKQSASAVRHHREEADCGSATHTERFAQSYSAKSRRGFFGVNIPSDSHSDAGANPVALVKKSYSPTPFHALPIRAIGFRDSNHFLAIEKWQEYLEGMTGQQIWYTV